MEYSYKKDWWETKDHKKIKISDMETSHIKNTIKYLQKNPQFYDEYYESYEFDCGEAYYYCKNNSHLVNKKIKELRYELDKRKENKENERRRN